jgi:hypothetical protein
MSAFAGVEDVAVRAVVLLELDERTGVRRAKSRSKCCMLATLAPRNA